MPVLNPAEAKLLADLSRNDVATIGRPRIKELVALCRRCVKFTEQADEQAFGQQFLANALWLAASGELTEEMIIGQARLTPEQRGDCLKMLQLRFDANAWREHSGFDLPPLPSATITAPVQDESEMEPAN